MKEIIKMLDENLKYIKYEIANETIKIYAKSRRKKVKCPYCGEETTKTHSRKMRKIQDLPIAGKKVHIMLERRKIKCKNPKCEQQTFTEEFEFINKKSRKSKRLEKEIMRVSLTQSSVSAAKYLSGSVAEVGKSTICKMLKKRETINDQKK